ncbi:MAG: dTDP-4-dehydrorhamnose reductase [Planctomycetes bacterium]|nr:dTDP-4-dehydrorhamnose reductase [Planctomycetota bacterium]
MNLPVIVLGARGMLGTDLMECLRRRNIPAQGYDLPELDITNAGHVESVVGQAKQIINCAAYTNVEKAESEAELAFRVNGRAVGQLGRQAAKRNIPVLHISTDFVFDGMLDRPYAETDAANPLSAYGKSKYEGEKALSASGCRFCIVRLQWTYGRAGTNFVKKLLDTARAGKPLRVVDDQVGSPTATREAAEIVCRMMELPMSPEGIYHLAAKGYVSRYEMAQFVFETLKVGVNLNPCKTSDFPSAAKRPLNSRFNCGKLEKLLGTAMRPWQEPLREHLEQV